MCAEGNPLWTDAIELDYQKWCQQQRWELANKILMDLAVLDIAIAETEKSK